MQFSIRYCARLRHRKRHIGIQPYNIEHNIVVILSVIHVNSGAFCAINRPSWNGVVSKGSGIVYGFADRMSDSYYFCHIGQVFTIIVLNVRRHLRQKLLISLFSNSDSDLYCSLSFIFWVETLLLLYFSIQSNFPHPSIARPTWTGPKPIEWQENTEATPVSQCRGTHQPAPPPLIKLQYNICITKCDWTLLGLGRWAIGGIYRFSQFCIR